MILKEATDVSYVQKFKDAKEPDDISNIIKEFCKNSNFNNYNEIEWNSFIDNNLHALNLECFKYNLDKDNPFFQFLDIYSKQNGNIQPFLDKQNYSILHNCISGGVLDIKQLSFKCREVDQIRILVNPYLWQITPKSDILYLIKIYTWIVDENLDTFILNAYVKAAFSKRIELKNGKVHFNDPKMNDLPNKIGLLKCLFFSDYIISLSEDKIKNNPKTPVLRLQEIQKNISNIKDSTSLVSHKFESVDLIEKQVQLLKQPVQESGRGVDGQKQETDTDNKYYKIKDKNSDNLLTSKQKQQILLKSDPIINSIKSTYQLKNKSDIKELLKILGDIY